MTLGGHRQNPGFEVSAFGGGGWLFGVTGAVVAVLTEVVGAVKRGETGRVVVVVRGSGR